MNLEPLVGLVKGAPFVTAHGIGPNTPRGTNKNPNRVPDLLTKVLPKAVSILARRSGNETISIVI